jgi:hypothetical protein
MNGNWLRVTPTQLAEAKDDLDSAYDLAEEAMNDEADRWFGLDKTWHALDFLLKRHGFGVPIVEGAESFAEEEDEEDAVDWGYGPPRYLTPAQVARAATELGTITEQSLLAGVDPAELARAEIYPNTWDRPGELEWAPHDLTAVADFFAKAATDGDAVICWIN